MAQRGTREWTLWVVAVSCGLHAAEEYLTGWQPWAATTLGIVMPTARFVVANGILVSVALAIARVGWRSPASLLYLPFSTWSFVGALRDGVPTRAAVTAVGGGTVMMVGVVVSARWLSGF